MKCDNTDFEKCLYCQKYTQISTVEKPDKPREERIVCISGGIKHWDNIDGEYKYRRPLMFSYRTTIDPMKWLYGVDLMNDESITIKAEDWFGRITSNH